METIYSQIAQAIDQAIAAHPVKESYGRDYNDLPEDLVVVRSVTLPLDDDLAIEVGASAPEAMPPFEWNYEITLREHKKPIDHFLLMDPHVYRAIRKDLTPLKEAEAVELLEKIKIGLES